MSGARGNRDLVYRIRALRTRATLLHLGAHPDDEDAGMLARLRLGDGVRVCYWSATRGEGGQNVSGPERGPALGLVRTWESIAARQVDGGELLYGPFYDFGFSKSGDAVLRRWGRDDVVREIARAIRMVQPDVVVTRWGGGIDDGHGHHQAIGLVAEQAFEAAADPDRYPELGLPAWRARKLYRSLGGDWQPGEQNARGRPLEADGIVSIDAGEPEPVSGLTYEELASIGLNRHRSQGIGVIPEPGSFFYSYEIVRTVDGIAGAFFDGIDTTLAGMSAEPSLRALLERAHARAVEAAEAFRPDDPARAVPALASLLELLREAGAMAAGAERYALERRARDAEEVLCRCAGVRVEARVDQVHVSPGAAVRVATSVIGVPAASVHGVELEAPAGWEVPPPARAGTSAELALRVPDDAAFTTPYWLRCPPSDARYEWPEDAPHARALNDPVAFARWSIEVEGVPVEVRAPLVQRGAVPGGTRALPLTVLPPVGLRPAERRLLRTVSSSDRRIALTVSAEAIQDEGAKGSLELSVPEGWIVTPDRLEIACARGERQVERHEVTLPPGVAPGRYRVSYAFESGGARYGLTVEPVRRGIGGAPADERTATQESFVLVPAEVEIDVVDVVLPGKLRYGYVAGVEEEIPRALSQLGVEVTELGDDALAYGDLSHFDAIVVGPRAYVVRAELRRNAARLLEHVEGGGTVIVQHQGFGYDDGTLAPYPFAYSSPHDRVTNPAAPVRMLSPDHLVFNVPNRIAESDFQGWIHERGLYFFGRWDHRYEPLLAAADDGEEPKAGGLMIAAVGRGTYVYCGYSFFRQIPAGVPGAIRLFANLLSLPDVRIRERAERMRAVPLFAGATEDELYEIARLASERVFEPEALLCHEGERSDEMFIVCDGVVEVRKRGALLATAEPGQIIGELAVLADVARSASLVARDHVRTLVLRGAHLRALLETHPKVATRMAAVLAEKLIVSGG